MDRFIWTTVTAQQGIVCVPSHLHTLLSSTHSTFSHTHTHSFSHCQTSINQYKQAHYATPALLLLYVQPGQGWWILMLHCVWHYRLIRSVWNVKRGQICEHGPWRPFKTRSPCVTVCVWSDDGSQCRFVFMTHWVEWPQVLGMNQQKDSKGQMSL